MSKDKKLRKILIDKLYNKNQNFLKQSTRSNAPTQSTPNQPKNFSKVIQNFFQNFEAQCAIIYQPVKLRDHKPLKRSLEQQLSSIYRDDKKLHFKAEDQQFSTISRHLFKNSSAIIQNKQKRQSFARIHTQNSNCQSVSKQKRIINTDANNPKIFKSNSMVFGSIPCNQQRIFSKPNTFDFQSNSIRQTNQSSIRLQKQRIPHQKIATTFAKQEDQFMTNSKNIVHKSIPKNAPVKMLQKPQKIDKIKRIQSLKNLNQNGIRKYSYRKEI